MPYVTSLERMAMKEGFEKGMQKGMDKGMDKGMERGMKQGMLETLFEAIELVLDLKFGTEGLKLMLEIREISDIIVLQTILRASKTAKNLLELQKLYSSKKVPTPPKSKKLKLKKTASIRKP